MRSAAEAVDSAVGWGPFLRAVAEAEQIAQPQRRPAFGQGMSFFDIGGVTMLFAENAKVMAAQRIDAVFGEIAAAGQRS